MNLKAIAITLVSMTTLVVLYWLNISTGPTDLTLPEVVNLVENSSCPSCGPATSF